MESIKKKDENLYLNRLINEREHPRKEVKIYL